MTKAMILAAGKGLRMRPLSDSTPKPLLKVGSHTLIERHLFALKEIGITEVVINLHHLAEKIMDYLGDGERYGLKIFFSQEKDELLNVGGGIQKALPLLGDKPFLLISSDILTAYPFSSLLNVAQQHQDASNHWLGHLIMVDQPSFCPKPDYCINDQGYLELTKPNLTYASFGVLHPKLFDHREPGHATFAEVMNPAIEKQAITGEHFQGVWYNVGTPEQLREMRELNRNYK